MNGLVPGFGVADEPWQEDAELRIVGFLNGPAETRSLRFSGSDTGNPPQSQPFGRKCYWRQLVDRRAGREAVWACLDEAGVQSLLYRLARQEDVGADHQAVS